MKKQVWILAGGNGAGKSTFYQQFLQPKGLAFVNADEIAKKHFPSDPEKHSYDAAQLAETLRLKLLAEGRSFCFETVFSHPSKIDFAALAKSYVYHVNLVFIHVNHADLNVARVQQRVIDGGHSVPEHKIRERIARTLKNVKIASTLADNFLVFDNSSLAKPFQTVLVKKQGSVKCRCEPFPAWAERFL